MSLERHCLVVCAPKCAGQLLQITGRQAVCSLLADAEQHTAIDRGQHRCTADGDRVRVHVRGCPPPKGVGGGRTNPPWVWTKWTRWTTSFATPLIEGPLVGAGVDEFATL